MSNLNFILIQAGLSKSAFIMHLSKKNNSSNYIPSARKKSYFQYFRF